MCTKNGAALTVLMVTCFAILFNCTKFFELEVQRNDECGANQWKTYRLSMGSIAMDETYQTVFVLWIVSIVMIFLPFLTLLVGNSLIAITIRKSMQRLK
jgi:hypothetical protein